LRFARDEEAAGQNPVLDQSSRKSSLKEGQNGTLEGVNEGGEKIIAES
jgi:hypothetical protein